MPFNSFDDYPMSWHPKRQGLSSPIYVSLAALLERDIRSGALGANVKLPPQRELADYLDLNVSTVTKAYKLAEQRGLVSAVVGRGTFVSPNARSVTSVVAEHRGEEVEMGTVFPYYEHNSIVRDVARDVLARESSAGLFEYADPLGSERQAAAGARWLTSLGAEAEAPDVVIAAGVQNALAILLASLFSPGDKVVVDEYTYPNFIGLANLLHLQLVAVGGDGGGMDAGELERVCATQRPRGIFAMPSGSNPANISFSPQRKAEVAEIARGSGIIVLEDDNYSALLGKEADPLSNYAPECCVYVSGLSKPVCSGLRIAYMRVPQRFRERVVKGAIGLDLKVPSLNIEIATQLVERGIVGEIAAGKRDRCRQRNAVFSHELPGCPCCRESFYQWVELPPGCTGRACELALAEQGVSVFGAERFAVGDAAGPGHVRVATCSPRTDGDLAFGLRALRRYVEAYGSPGGEFIV